jgi:ferric-dicitrate binding protein FerR (iron transport regulator)
MKEENEEQIAALLRLAGPRPRVSDERVARVREAVHAEWQRNVRRRTAAWSLGIAAAAILVVVLFLPRTPQRSTPIATKPVIVAQAQVPPYTKIAAATWIETHANTLSLDWNGATLRLDEGTRLRVDSAHAATLERGAIYFDGEKSGVVIHTALGDVRDVGTRFEVRLADRTLRIRVRSGRVDLQRGRKSYIADAATELVAFRERVERNAIAISGADWAWIENAAPPLRLEGLSLREAVTRVAREKGLRVELRDVDGTARLHGSVDFTLDEALEAATAATSSSYRIQNGTLIVRKR